MQTLAYASLIIYLFCSFWFLIGSSLQLHLLLKSGAIKIFKGFRLLKKPERESELPIITIQVPVFNERFVISRLLESLGKLDYPTSHFEVQILDDSNDETSAIIRKCVKQLELRGISVQILYRDNRKGFKAGALQAGLQHAKGSLLAIFDADFEPNRDFLKIMSRHFSDPRVGGVQGRWGHRNLSENWLTMIQTYLLDCHFTLEQQGRLNAGYFLNFNGTAGMWRKKCIEDVGGWNGAVLTEDLELSYRAQLHGWKFLYDHNVVVPADLPVDMDDFKTQQFRWAKGLAQSATCHLKNVIRAKISFAKKLHASFHLLGSVSFVAVFGNFLLALPIIISRHYMPEFREYSQIIAITGITLPVLITYYAAGTKANLTRLQFWKHLPLFLVVYMALSVQNTIAVIQGMAGMSSPFVRTPKPGNNIVLYQESFTRWTWINTMELVSLLYIISSIILAIIWKDLFLITFLIMGAVGLFLVLKPAMGSFWIRRKKQPAPVIRMDFKDSITKK